ncbi:hypothetical protein H4R33_006642 [Dimargaris cristalligena]|nr:hypothetical protein H4R33_006642 [Dimargaris cristalligena]
MAPRQTSGDNRSPVLRRSNRLRNKTLLGCIKGRDGIVPSASHTPSCPANLPPNPSPSILSPTEMNPFPTGEEVPRPTPLPRRRTSKRRRLGHQPGAESPTRMPESPQLRPCQTPSLDPPYLELPSTPYSESSRSRCLSPEPIEATAARAVPGDVCTGNSHEGNPGGYTLDLHRLALPTTTATTTTTTTTSSQPFSHFIDDRPNDSDGGLAAHLVSRVQFRLGSHMSLVGPVGGASSPPPLASDGPPALMYPADDYLASIVTIDSDDETYELAMASTLALHGNSSVGLFDLDRLSYSTETEYDFVKDFDRVQFHPR